MATANDVIGALADLHEKQARRINDEPTGVEPGYHAALGGTVKPNGTIRYVGAAATISARVGKDPGQSITSSGTLTGTTLDWTLAYDVANSGGMYDATYPSRLTAPVPGVYLATLHVLWASQAGGVRQISLYWYDLSATADNALALSTVPEGGVAVFQALCAPPLLLDTGDYVYAKVAQNSGSTVSILYNSATFSPTFSLTKLG